MQVRVLPWVLARCPAASRLCVKCGTLTSALVRVSTTPDGPQMNPGWTSDARWIPDGPPMSPRWTPDELQIDPRWTTYGLHMDPRWTSDGSQWLQGRNSCPCVVSGEGGVLRWPHGRKTLVFRFLQGGNSLPQRFGKHWQGQGTIAAYGGRVGGYSAIDMISHTEKEARERKNETKNEEHYCEQNAKTSRLPVTASSSLVASYDVLRPPPPGRLMFPLNIWLRQGGG